MTDFIAYVVSELKSKRLSKASALSLVKQFSHRVSRVVAPMLHPMLHRNVSDLSEQRYESRFSGEEFYLADHQVSGMGESAVSVLPGVAYLEMARAALEQAVPEDSPRVLELRNTVWARPMVVTGERAVSVVLYPAEAGRIDYEIVSEESGERIVHCQGQGEFEEPVVGERLDAPGVRERMSGGRWEAAAIYAAFGRRGLQYGAAHRAIEWLERGEGELLAQLVLPAVVSGSAGEYGLHPSVLDGALQASIGLLEGLEGAGPPRLPFALESVRIAGRCSASMQAWVRYAPGSGERDAVEKLDIDIYDAHGTVCVQLRGFTSRVLGESRALGGEPRALGGEGTARPAEGVLLARPVWVEAPAAAGSSEAPGFTQHHVLVCGLAKVNLKKLSAGLPGSECTSVAEVPGNVAQCYGEYALRSFERLQGILRSKPVGRVLLQIVGPVGAMLGGLSGLLKSGMQENPQLVGQLIETAGGVSTAELMRQLQSGRAQPQQTWVREVPGRREALRWEVQPQGESGPVVFKDGGVYVITGGLGGLGRLLTREMVERGSAQVIVTGRGEADGESVRGALSALRGQVLRPEAVSYRRLDLQSGAQVREELLSIRAEHGRLDGIVHGAGMIADNFIVKKSAAEFTQVLRPKVEGTYHLDEASREMELDFLVLFGSVAGALGNVGQADYAAANGFMDQYAGYRNGLVESGERRGRTVSIDWPLWADGGMSVEAQSLELLQERTGMRPLTRSAGLQALQDALAAPQAQTLVLAGELALLERLLSATPAAGPAAGPAAAGEGHSGPRGVVPAGGGAPGEGRVAPLVEKTQDFLRRQFSQLLKLPAQQIDVQAPLEQYGIDSILAMSLTNQLEKTFGSLSKTLFFEYRTVRELADYFVDTYAVQLSALLFAPSAVVAVTSGAAAASTAKASPRARSNSEHRFSRPRDAARREAVRTSSSPAGRGTAEPIAIIGLSGRYPESADLEAYWSNLRDGRDCIIEVPKERWDWKEYFSEDRTKAGHHFSKWGGFIAGVDEFDPLFFNISPVEAEMIDPQERLFLQHAWMAVEDAGYTRASLQVPHENDLAGQVGVYVGVMYSEYQLFGADATARGRRMGIVGSYASIANRVSYALNLHGPSMTLDTMCSSSLTAIHLACQDLKQGRTDVAIAGGVNVSIHPNKYLVLSDGQFISGDGQCQSFGEGGDGYIPGEGVGAVVLRRLSEAQRDGHHIYGVITGSALSHGGRTNGYTVPNPQAQASAITRALSESGTAAREISYLEAHGTGTKLGDPIEIAALSNAFQRHTQEREFCLIGSAKSNIGHCESAAGIAGLTKVLLQMRHGQIVPSLHSSRLNPHIDFTKSPFVVNQTLRRWERPVIEGRGGLRIAGISSFGAGGSNAHMIVQEYEAGAVGAAVRVTADAPAAMVLSARTAEQLRQKAQDLLAFVEDRGASGEADGSGGEVDLGAVAYTLQVGREAMEERWGFTAGSTGELVEKLRAYVQGAPDIEESYQGQVKRNKEALSVFSTDADLQQTIEKWLAGKKLTKLLDLWVKGLEVDWTKLYGAARPGFVSLPSYPFAKERYWIETGAPVRGAEVAAGTVLHPMLHRNVSDLSEQRYESRFSGEEFYLADHQVSGMGESAVSVLPGVAYLEMARAALEQAVPEDSPRVLELRNTVWARPMVVTGERAVSVVLYPAEAGRIDYEIVSEESGERIVHCQGQGEFEEPVVGERLDAPGVRERMSGGRWEAAAIYAAFGRRGLQYGAAHRAIEWLERGEGELLAQLVLPAVVSGSAGEYGLHPSVLDGALQASIGLLEGLEGAGPPRLPFALESVRIAGRCSASMQAWVRYAPGSGERDAVEKLDIDIYDAHGTVCVQLRGFTSRVLGESRALGGEPRALGGEGTARPAEGVLLARPVWVEAPAVAGSSEAPGFTQHHVLVCGLAKVNLKKLSAGLPGSECTSVAEVPGNVAQCYGEYALRSFERLQGILRSKPVGRVLLQIVGPVGAMLGGLSGLLKSGMQENPQLVGQLIETAGGVSTAELMRQLQSGRAQPQQTWVREVPGRREALRWEVQSQGESGPVVFKDGGVYVITGGLGGLGRLLTREMVERGSAQVIVTGRGEADGESVRGALSALRGQVLRPEAVSYRRLDLQSGAQVREELLSIRAEHGRLDGIVHGAGMIADNFIVKKSAAEFTQVLRPKVEGTYHLDEASREMELDFLVLFGSVAGALGNVGQADYAAANGFMDQYAGYRNGLVESGERRGRTVSINWPLWADGGMSVEAQSLELLQERTGMRPLTRAAGLQALQDALAAPQAQTLVLAGELALLERLLSATPAAGPAAGPAAAGEGHSGPRGVVPAGGGAPGEGRVAPLVEKTQDFLRRQFSQLLKLPAQQIDVQAPLEQYGIDSILAMKLTNRLEETFGSLSKTLFFEYQTIDSLARYFASAFPLVFRDETAIARVDVTNPNAVEARSDPARVARAARSSQRFLASNSTSLKEVAIVGLSGRYPGAADLGEFWDNLKVGRDCITEIPADRWDSGVYYDPDRTRPGKSYSKWGGFIADVDKFDPLFFNISPKEAELIDPQERLFLETAWATIEDAGYAKESFSTRRVGVYVGVMWGHYEMLGAGSLASGNTSFPSSSHASIANRVSYFFNFHGPSIALDTMCSSSLTAIHLASEEIRRGGIDVALAGGVNVSIHPYKYLSLSQGKFVASDGRCRSFGDGGDGYVPGEGVGAVLLKPLDHALRDGDHIYGIVKSSAINHGGKTNGYSVPNPNAQGDLILEALKKAHIDPTTLGYIETHGTGTSLGDPIEITGLSKAFVGFTQDKQYCPIGSVKSNIGHLEAAAGIAALTKALLQIRFGQLVPSLHADVLNPHIDFHESPFYVQTELADWKRPANHPRRAGVSSFGAGGANAHLVIEEFVDTRAIATRPEGPAPEIFVLSARDPDALVNYARKMLAFLDGAADMPLEHVAFTSQLGRTPMNARLAITTSSVADLKSKLSLWITSRPADLEDVFHGQVNKAQYNAGNLIDGDAGRLFLENLLERRELTRIAKLWILGAEIDWARLHVRSRPRRVPLPTYPFAKERYWIDVAAQPVLPAPTPASQPAARQVIEEVAEAAQRTYYGPRWTVTPPLRDTKHRPGPVLLLDDTDAFFRALKLVGAAQSGEGPCILVMPGTAYEESAPSVFVIDYEREEHFLQLVETLDARGQLPRSVIHRGSDAPDASVSAGMERRLAHGVYALFHLSKALMARKHSDPVDFISVYSKRSSVADALHSALAGFYKSLALETTRYTGRVVEIESRDDSEGSKTVEEAALVLAELRAGGRSGVRYQFAGDEAELVGGAAGTYTRSVQDLAAYVAGEHSGELPFRRNGVYIVTGGLGGLGYIVCDYLARNYQSRLVIVGRSPLTFDKEHKIGELQACGSDVLYVDADIAQRSEAERVANDARSRFGEINGIVHCAGVTRDAFMLKKTKAEMEAVLAAKVFGTLHLDEVTADEPLDAFLLFSSIAGVMGNVGQCDYAYANHFLDSFAAYREHLCATQRRSGRNLSINWPLWEDGGMGLPPEAIASMEAHAGLMPLPTHEGIQYWEDFLRSSRVQGIALYGQASKIQGHVARSGSHGAIASQPVETIGDAELRDAAERYLRTSIGELIKLDPDRIHSQERFESFGIDSIMVGQFNANVERDFGSLPKTLLYEYETIEDLAKYLVAEARAGLLTFLGIGGHAAAGVAPPPVSTAQSAEPSAYRAEPAVHSSPGEERSASPSEERSASPSEERIAVIGIHGRYPHSDSLEDYWENLKQGRDLIDLVPANRWDYEEFYDADPAAASEGKIYGKWGGFLSDHDRFDPEFFSISSEDARLMDPQERLVLESVWSAIEDAGYTRETLKEQCPKGKSADVGVFIGVTTNSYHLLAAEERSRGNMASPTSLPWSIANRVSYFFDFNGPSMPVDTACSSSLVALHLACDSLKAGECEVAIAGGVNLYSHPSKYQSFCQKRMLSVGGRCRSYGAGDDGFVPGEGVGTLMLKPLSKAIAHHDRIHATLAGSAFDHSGRSNGYSVPNPNSQASLIGGVLKQANVHPESIGYVEGHGTGTQLGDSIEVAALTQAFREHSSLRHFCPIGSVKANIGHAESAAGMAGVTKVILQLQHRQLVPSIHSDEVNPNIEFDDSPFYLQHGLTPWESSQPRRALVNSFGAGGVNACVVLEEYAPAPDAALDGVGPQVFLLSARNESRLQNYAKIMLARLETAALPLANVCHTLQVGREAMEERLAIVASSSDDLLAALAAFLGGSRPANLYRGCAGRPGKSKAPRRRAAQEAQPERRTLEELAAAWTAGEDVDWPSLRSGDVPARVALPTYPFAKERYWVSDSLLSKQRTTWVPKSTALHPLISHNASTLREVGFVSLLSDTAFYASDHTVNDVRIFPGAGFLEIGCVAGSIAGERSVGRIKDVVWNQPLSFQSGPQTVRTFLKDIGGSAEYAVTSLNEDNERTVHSEGRLFFRTDRRGPPDQSRRVPIERLKQGSSGRRDGAQLYDTFRALGLGYGPAFRVIQEIYVAETYALSRLKIAPGLRTEFDQYLLHPCLVDGALQSVVGLVDGMQAGVPYIPFALDEVEFIRPLTETCYALVKLAAQGRHVPANIKKFDLQLLSEAGDLLVDMKSLYVRALVRTHVHLPVSG